LHADGVVHRQARNPVFEPVGGLAMASAPTAERWPSGLPSG
jgi:hypothetical protein